MHAAPGDIGVLAIHHAQDIHHALYGSGAGASERIGVTEEGGTVHGAQGVVADGGLQPTSHFRAVRHADQRLLTGVYLNPITLTSQGNRKGLHLAE
jgi:hypothetical protein